ncbi:MAG TPA: biosynthetic arginine decarboxylase [Pseudomonadales bacterium]|nr:biosynthetic arginine decarboxylase [Pseudomonadales bacterium]HMW83990.1 biosynthetic arginine decarboxylase [Pseudomonadales bacterium]HMY97001.1 biosynthetic arginine decarboxylase [Pseudomonadales bacterium]HNC76710.1 biosynthetic arginine decarboxylase [Pseudomonadales bacterium]HNF08056.1 biosynthetic arginine decarboxylase [Pseudomonadales bacterium]
MAHDHTMTAAAHFRVARWGEGYFDIDAQGEVVVAPRGARAPQRFKLTAIADRVRAQGLNYPILLRFTDIIADRLTALSEAFEQALARSGHASGYRAIYPIKVNQQREVVEAMVAAQKQRGYVGLEAGSKPELLIVLANAEPGCTRIVCNGYKDRDFVRLALLGEKLGHCVYLVIESLSEVELILDEAARLGVRPRLGVRVRLATVAKGNWQNTGGEKSKFGLSAAQILTLVERLQRAGRLDCLEMLHSHIGSQIADLEDIRRGSQEAARFYGELHRLGAAVQVVNLGGGLSVDYDGSFSSSYFSMNYRFAEYAGAIIEGITVECARRQLPFPQLMSESGRALTAHHALLLTDVADVERPVQEVAPAATLLAQWAEVSPVHRRLVECHQRLEAGDLDHARNALQWMEGWLDELETLFAAGEVSLRQRAEAEQLHAINCRKIAALLAAADIPDDGLLAALREKLADRLYVNFSLFQSMPDIWGIDQIFPVLPLSGLDQPLQRRALIHDITCDSDGRLDRYVTAERTTLALPEFDPHQPPLIGFFLLGAYQETLGDLHNLFGRVDSVNVTQSEAGELCFTETIPGESVAQVLRAVDYQPEQLFDLLAERVREGIEPGAERERLLQLIAMQASTHTYFRRDTEQR